MIKAILDFSENDDIRRHVIYTQHYSTGTLVAELELMRRSFNQDKFKFHLKECKKLNLEISQGLDEIEKLVNMEGL